MGIKDEEKARFGNLARAWVSTGIDRQVDSSVARLVEARKRGDADEVARLRRLVDDTEIRQYINKVSGNLTYKENEEWIGLKAKHFVFHKRGGFRERTLRGPMKARFEYLEEKANTSVKK